MNQNFTTDQVQEQLVQLQVFLEEAKQKWDSENPQPKSWFDKNKAYIVKTTIFLIGITDNLINLVETFLLKGPDKKIAVLAIATQLFDYVASKAFPIWISPFIPVIKQIVISIIISNMIEFIVSKYKEGAWKWENKTDASRTV